MDELACSGTESRLDACTFTSGNTCSHTEDIILACGFSSVPGTVSDSNNNWAYRLVGGSSSTAGRLEIDVLV